MNNFTTLFQFACEFFGYENISRINKEQIKMYYNDWKNNYSKITIEQYKLLLNIRG